jgi:phage tail sheath protein FI
VAPANERLLGVVALVPRLAPESWQALQDAAINLIRDDARGFLALAADTLSPEAELRQVNVRRLLTLLRRLALRRGTRYVFEPNGPTLRRAVQRGFDTLLTDLFRRGAFAGRTADTSFRVVTDDTVNTRIDNDAGRFIVELRVAPSLPLSFLTLLLAQTGERLTVAEEL